MGMIYTSARRSSSLNSDICLTKSFQADRDPRERGPRPLNSYR
jgi:hypothetical protein